MVRRQTSYFLPAQDTREYQAWISQRLKWRQAVYEEPIEPGLLSILTPVWNGSPVRYLRALADSLIGQNESGGCEWFILDNGLSKQNLQEFLQKLAAYSWIKVQRVSENVGIIAGLRVCLEKATGRYVLPVDADDFLDSDALRVVASWIRRTKYPALLYSDEDKIHAMQRSQPYMKPDWDPVLFLNSAYIAHLGVMKREKALELGVYSDPAVEGSPDWDAFMRFVIAGYAPVHIPEIIYSWRIHARSTADDAANKPYIHRSQRTVLQSFLDSRSSLRRFSVRHSPLLGKAAHWHFVRERREPKPCISVVLRNDGGEGNRTEIARENRWELRRLELDLTSSVDALVSAVNEMEVDAVVHFVGEDVEIEGQDWFWEALGLFEIHEDAVMVGGRIRNDSGIITGAGLHFGFGGVCGCPDRGRSVRDCGYFTQMWKQHSVSAVSTQFAVARVTFLTELLESLPHCASLAFLGAWAGAHAFRNGKRIVYSPFLSGISNLDWETLPDTQEQAIFAELNRDLIPDSRFYSQHLSLEKPFSLREPATMAAYA